MDAQAIFQQLGNQPLAIRWQRRKEARGRRAGQLQCNCRWTRPEVWQGGRLPLTVWATAGDVRHEEGAEGAGEDYGHGVDSLPGRDPRSRTRRRGWLDLSLLLPLRGRLLFTLPARSADGQGRPLWCGEPASCHGWAVSSAAVREGLRRHRIWRAARGTEVGGLGQRSGRGAFYFGGNGEKS